LSQKQALDILQNTKIKFDVKSWIILNFFALKGTI